MDIKDIQSKCSDGNIVWSKHAVDRMLSRNIKRNDVINCIMNGEIIEEYPDYWLSPACLVYGLNTSDAVLHVVVGNDGTKIYIVTVYHPTTEKFESDLKTRKR